MLEQDNFSEDIHHARFGTLSSCRYNFNLIRSLLKLK